MKNMKQKEFEKELPSGYRQVFYLNAKSIRVGLVLNLIAFAVLVAVMAVALIPLIRADRLKDVIWSISENLIAFLVFYAAIFVYIVLHELTHGIVYKSLTGEKLTFGMSWSCAFCGVPHIYVKRRVSLIASAAPLLVFSVIMLPLTVLLYFVDPLYYLLSALVFGLHLGGCGGDIYIILLMLFRYRNPETLVRDTGPEQTVYVPIADSESEEE